MLCFSYAPLRRGAAAGGGRAIVNASRRIDQQFCLLTSGAILSSSLGARSAAYVGPPKPDRTAAITIRLPMSCSSRIGAYPALRLAFLRLDDIGSAVAPLTGFLRSIGRSISFYPAILCDQYFFRSSPPYRMITRRAELSDRAASRYRAGPLWGEPPAVRQSLPGEPSGFSGNSH